MSQKSKKAASARRAGMKRARKEAQQKQYQTWRDMGVNALSRRAKANKKGSKLIGSRRRDPNSTSWGHSAPPYSMPKMNDSTDPRVRFDLVTNYGQQSKPQTSLALLQQRQKQNLSPDRELSQADTRRLLKYLGQPEGSAHIYGPRLARQMIVNTPAVIDENRPLAKVLLKQLMALKGLSEKEAKLVNPKEARELLANV